MQLNQSKALITGGVSGLGLAVARKVVASGGQQRCSSLRPNPKLSPQTPCSELCQMLERSV